MKSYVPVCKDCGEHLLGDGYRSVLHCPYVDEEFISQGHAPDAGPFYCDFDETQP